MSNSLRVLSAPSAPSAVAPQGNLDTGTQPVNPDAAARLPREPLTVARRVRLSRQRARGSKARVEVTVPAGWPVVAIKLLARLLTRAKAKADAGTARRDGASLRRRCLRFWSILRDEEVGR